MRVLAIGIATIAIVLMGLTLRPTPEATAAMSGVSAGVDPAALQSTIDPKTLPELTGIALY